MCYGFIKNGQRRWRVFPGAASHIVCVLFVARGGVEQSYRCLHVACAGVLLGVLGVYFGRGVQQHQRGCD